MKKNSAGKKKKKRYDMKFTSPNEIKLSEFPAKILFIKVIIISPIALKTNTNFNLITSFFIMEKTMVLEVYKIIY